MPGIGVLTCSCWCPQAESSPTRGPQVHRYNCPGDEPHSGGGRRDPGRGNDLEETAEVQAQHRLLAFSPPAQ